ncbi:MAG: hypothetical protein ACR2OV_09620 [Hyphomicrobiaceae bacterium]
MSFIDAGDRFFATIDSSRYYRSNSDNCSNETDMARHNLGDPIEQKGVNIAII